MTTKSNNRKSIFAPVYSYDEYGKRHRVFWPLGLLMRIARRISRRG